MDMEHRTIAHTTTSPLEEGKMNLPLTWVIPARRAAVLVFVMVHLTFLVTRNLLDATDYSVEQAALGKPWFAPWEPGWKTAQDWTGWYQHMTTVEQRWLMFATPVAQAAPFLAVQWEFTDGSHEVLLSDNEPPDPKNYWRWDNTRLRKYEDWLLEPPGDLDNAPDAPLWRAYLRWRWRCWRDRHPDDKRELRRAFLLERRTEFPPPENPTVFVAPKVRVLATFACDGGSP